MPPKNDRRRATQAKHRLWIKALCDFTGRDPTTLAREAGIAGTTITRLLNDPRYLGTLSSTTIHALMQSFAVPGPDEITGAGFVPGFCEAERVDPNDQKFANIPACVTGLSKSNQLDIWRIRTDALVEAGYLPGDLIIVDTHAQPQARDAVCARVFDLARRRAETIWRMFDPPFLLSAARDPMRYKPMLIGSAVELCGVVVASVRLRQPDVVAG